MQMKGIWLYFKDNVEFVYYSIVSFYLSEEQIHPNLMNLNEFS